MSDHYIYLLLNKNQCLVKPITVNICDYLYLCRLYHYVELGRETFNGTNTNV